MSWYIFRKQGTERWTACEVPANKTLQPKRGYEMRGPYRDIVRALIAANQEQEAPAQDEQERAP